MITNLMICPYCKGPLSTFGLDSDRDSLTIAIARCNCDEYPLIAGIAYLKKTDSLINKHAVSSIKQGKIWQAVWICLGEESKSIKLVTFIAFFLAERFKFVLPQQFVLTLLSYVGSSSAWFRYLLKRPSHSDFQTAQSLLGKSDAKSVVDIGCGIGQLIQAQLNTTNTSSTAYIGLDRLFASLILAKIYALSPRANFIVCDVNLGLPFKPNMADKVIMLDSFSYIFAKNRVIQESARILKKAGQIILINIHNPLPETYWWSYGMSPQHLKLILKSYFHAVHLFSYSQSEVNENSREYGLTAVKT